MALDYFDDRLLIVALHLEIGDSAVELRGSDSGTAQHALPPGSWSRFCERDVA
jgi:hypothetical protein